MANSNSMTKCLRALGAVVLAGWLAGCASSPAEDEVADPAVKDRPLSEAESGPVEASDSGIEVAGVASALPGSGEVEGVRLEDEVMDELTRVIYFDFDSAEIHPDEQVVIEAHAQFLTESGGAVLVLEGHADERGSREYNVALGERRASKVREVLRLLGASDEQVRTVSFGEERPASLGHDESSWGLNRRVEFNYASQ